MNTLTVTLITGAVGGALGALAAGRTGALAGGAIGAAYGLWRSSRGTEQPPAETLADPGYASEYLQGVSPSAYQPVFGPSAPGAAPVVIAPPALVPTAVQSPVSGGIKPKTVSSIRARAGVPGAPTPTIGTPLAPL